MLTVALTGMLTGASLIIVIGAQNAWVLRQGLRRQRVGVVITICAVSDAMLIALGTGGIGWVAALSQWILVALRWIGAGYLIWMGLRSLLAAWRNTATLTDEPVLPTSRIVLTTLALTWLNPHVYLDTVLMLGGIANQHGSTGRWWFAGGAMFASLLWFTGLGVGARAVAPLLAKPVTWRLLDAFVGITMLVVATTLLLLH